MNVMIRGVGRIKGVISRLLANRLQRKPSAHGEKREIAPSGERHVEPASHSGETWTEYGKGQGSDVDPRTKLSARKRGPGNFETTA
ncbi:MAG: hypothetical protein V1676_04150 [Candidatus Diapherotrites archaeon]